MMKWHPRSRRMPMFSAESSRKSRGPSVSWRQRPMVSSRNWGVSFWQCCFPSRSSRLARYPSLIGKHGRIAIVAFVGPGHAFLACLRIVERGHVHVYRDISARQLRWDAAVESQHLDVLVQVLSADGAADQVEALAQCLRRGDGVADAKGRFIKIRVVVHFMHGIKRGLAHALHADICKHDVTVLYLVLGMVAADFHVVAVLDEIALAKDRAHDSKPAAWDDALICKFNRDIFSHGDLRDLFLH